mgnify:CR=1 FL=1
MTTSHSSASSWRKSAPVRVISSGDELNPFVSLLEKLTHTSEKFVGIGLVIVQETNALVAQAAIFSGSEPSLFGDSGRRWIDNTYQLFFHFCALQTDHV